MGLECSGVDAPCLSNRWQVGLESCGTFRAFLFFMKLLVQKFILAGVLAEECRRSLQSAEDFESSSPYLFSNSFE